MGDDMQNGSVEKGEPLDEGKLRKLKFVMALMSGFLVLTFMVVVAAFVWRLSGSGGEGAARAGSEGALLLRGAGSPGMFGRDGALEAAAW